MNRIGLGKVCYGDILLGGPGMAKNEAAFYSPPQDEMFVRPNSTDGAVRAVCHELTHRLVNKFLKGKDDEIAQLYSKLKASGGPFVTPYAKGGGPEENFCEMISFWAVGKLPELQVEILQSIVG